MTERERRFADEYLIDLNATRAYRAAYPASSADNARKNAPKVKKRPEVADYIFRQLSLQQERLRRIREEKALADQERAERERAEKERADRERADRERADREHMERERAERQEEILCEIMKIALGQAPDVTTRDRLRALELLGKHFGMFVGKDALDREEQAARIEKLRAETRSGAAESSELRVIFVNTDGAEA